MSKVQIIIREEGKEEIKLDFDKFRLSVDFGILEHPPESGFKMAKVESNGQKLMTLEAWSGCEDPESFQNS